MVPGWSRGTISDIEWWNYSLLGSLLMNAERFHMHNDFTLQLEALLNYSIQINLARMETPFQIFATWPRTRLSFSFFFFPFYWKKVLSPRPSLSVITAKVQATSVGICNDCRKHRDLVVDILESLILDGYEPHGAIYLWADFQNHQIGFPLLR